MGPLICSIVFDIETQRCIFQSGLWQSLWAVRTFLGCRVLLHPLKDVHLLGDLTKLMKTPRERAQFSWNRTRSPIKIQAQVQAALRRSRFTLVLVLEFTLSDGADDIFLHERQYLVAHLPHTLNFCTHLCFSWISLYVRRGCCDGLSPSHTILQSLRTIERLQLPASERSSSPAISECIYKILEKSKVSDTASHSSVSSATSNPSTP